LGPKIKQHGPGGRVIRPLFLFYGRSAVQTGRNTKKKGCRLTEW